MLDDLKEEKNNIDSKRLVSTKSDGTIFNFNVFKSSLEFASDIYNGKILLVEAKKDRYKMQLKDLEKYDPKNPDKINSRKETLINVKKFYNNKNNVIRAFEDRVFLFKDGFWKKESDMSDEALPDWVKVDKERFSKTKNEIQHAINKNLQARSNRGSPTCFDESCKLIQDIKHSKITHEEALKTITNIRNNIKRINDLNEFNSNQVKLLNALFMVDEHFAGEFKWYKLSDTGYTLLR